MHVAIIGVGRLGRTIAYTLIQEDYVDELSLVDVVPNLTKSFKEELLHVLAGIIKDVKINAYEKPSEVEEADIVLITAGKPRTANMTRRDLIKVNAKIMASIAKEIYKNNEKARYIIIANPCDALATLFKKLTEAEFVISSGNHLDSIRFRAELSKRLNVRMKDIIAYVGGEHGKNSVFLWSLTRIKGLSFDEYVKKNNIKVDKNEIENSVKDIARQIIANLGATLYGPAIAFRDIVRAIALNLERVLSIASPYKSENIPEEVMVSIPRVVGWTLGPSLFNYLSEEEKEKINEAAKVIYQTYKEALNLIK